MLLTIGEHTTVDADSFLMKGEEIAPHQHWRGNAAQVIAGREPAEAPRTVITLPERATNGDVARAG